MSQSNGRQELGIHIRKLQQSTPHTKTDQHQEAFFLHALINMILDPVLMYQRARAHSSAKFLGGELVVGTEQERHTPRTPNFL